MRVRHLIVGCAFFFLDFWMDGLFRARAVPAKDASFRVSTMTG